MSAQKRYNTYRQTFPEFVYQDYEYTMQSDGLHMCFHFKLSDKLCFAVRSSVPTRQFINLGIPKDQLDLLVFNIGMAELVSYWKAFCPPLVRIAPHGLTEEQKCFWKKLYFNGLGEFFYVNGIRATIDDFMTIEAEGEPLKPVAFSQFDDKASESFIVPIGGGKDSVVTLDCLQSYSARLQLDSPLPLIMNPRGATVECCRVAGYEHGDFLEIRRAIDPLLLDLNAKGALNGHTPFSAMLAFYTLLVSALTGRRHIALSNESSANEATDIANGVNHQYSKSLEFENDFRDSVLVVAIMLVVGGVFMLFCDKLFNKGSDANKVNEKRAFNIGLYQCISVIPGVSRSMATIVGGMTQGLTRQRAAEFSFFLAVPTMAGATLLDLLDLLKEDAAWATPHNITMLVLGCVVAFVVALLAMKWFVAFLTKYGFKAFGYYRIIVGGIILVLLLTGHSLAMVD